MRLWAALTALLLLAWPLPVTAAAPEPTTIYEALGLRNRAANYFVLMDTSGSMAGRLSTVKRQLKGLLRAKDDADRVTLLLFDGKVHRRTLLESETDVDELDTPTGKHTDVGRGLEWVVDHLRDHPQQLTALMLVSDGVQDPAPGSAYGIGNGPAWTRLRERAAKLKPPPQVYTFSFGDEKVRQFQDAIVERVFPNNSQILDPQQYRQAQADLSIVKDEARRAEARRGLVRDLKRGVTVAWRQPVVRLQPTEGSGDLVLTIRSETTVLPLEVSSLQVTVSRGEVPVRARPAQSTPVRLEPGGAVEVPVELSWTPPSPVRASSVDIDLSRSVHVGVKVRSPWEGELGLLGLSYGERQSSSESASVSGRFQAGPSWWTAAIPAGVVLALVMLLVWRRRTRRRHTPKMIGRLWATYLKEADDGWEEHRLGPVELTGHAPMPASQLAPPLPPGSVRGTVTVWPTDRGVKIAYELAGPAERSDTALCPKGRKIMINGVEFHYETRRDDA